MSHKKELKESKIKCNNDILKPTYQTQNENTKKKSTNSQGTSIYQGVYKTNSTSNNGYQGNKENKINDRRVLLAITVEIEDGCIEHIEMKEGDSAQAVAEKFCQDHNLPDQFVAPLTEHIVSNIISISKEDKDIVFCSKDECTLYEDNWTCKEEINSQGNNNIQCEQKTFRSFGSNNLIEEKKLAICEKENNYFQKGQKSPLIEKKKSNVLQKKVLNCLISPTITSLAKSGHLDVKEKPKPHVWRPNLVQTKAVYMRLYTEFMKQKDKQEKKKKLSFERYQEKIENSRINISKKSWRVMLMRGRIAKQYRNYGELLYVEGLTKRKNQEKLIEKKKKDDEIKELCELTGIPEISKRAKSLRRKSGKIWKRLNQFEDKSKQDQLQELRNEMWKAQFIECTFKPQINHQRDESYDEKTGFSNRFEQLFLDAKNRRQRQAEYIQWYPEGVTFRPTINKAHVDGMDTNGEYCSIQEGTVFDRLLQYASKLTEKKQIQEHLVHRLIDPTTGRRFFKPLIGRKPQINRNPVHLPIGEYLYKLKFAFDSKKQSLATHDTRIKKEQASCHYVGPTSQKLLGCLEKRGFKKIFECLDEDKDGKVVLATANYDKLSVDTIQDIMEVIKDQNLAEKSLTCSQFIELMLGAEKKCHRATIKLVLKYKPHVNQTNDNQQFKMDQLSRNLACRRRKFNTSRQWYKIICIDKERRQQKIEELRKEKQDQEMAKCTFRPEMMTKGRKKGSRLKGGGVGFIEAMSSTVGKVQQEVHGFYFQDERGPEWGGLPIEEPIIKMKPQAESRETVAVQVSASKRLGPKGLLESLKVMVAESLGSQGARRNLSQHCVDQSNEALYQLQSFKKNDLLLTIHI